MFLNNFVIGTLCSTYLYVYKKIIPDICTYPHIIMATEVTVECTRMILNIKDNKKTDALIIKRNL